MEISEKLEEIKSDFEHIFDDIDISGYNPLAPDIQKLINVGLMWFLVDRIKHKMDKAIHHEQDHIQDELMSAEEYLHKYMEDKDITLKQMVKDELKHADYFIKQAKMLVKSGDEQVKIQRYVNWYNDILEKLG